MVQVNIRRMRDGSMEDIESMISRFRKSVERENVLAEWKEREYYKRPSIVRHERECARRHKYKLMKRQGYNDI